MRARRPVQFAGQAAARLAVVDLPAFRPSMNRNVSLALMYRFSRQCVSVRHLRRPNLVSEPRCSSNHPGLMKVLARSRYDAATSGSGWARSDRQLLCRGWPSAAERSSRNSQTIAGSLMTRVGKGACAASGVAHRSRAPCPPAVSRTWWARRATPSLDLRSCAGAFAHLTSFRDPSVQC